MTRNWVKDTDLYLFGAVLLLTALGILLIYSAGDGGKAPSTGALYEKQLIWLIVAIGFGLTAFMIPIKWWEAMAYPFYALSLLFLAVLIVKSGVGEDASRWIQIGPVQIQPAEFAKVFTVMALARYLSNRKKPIDSFKGYFLPLVFVSIPIALIAAQPDLGTSAVFLAILLGTLFWSGIPLEHLFLLILSALSPLLIIFGFEISFFCRKILLWHVFNGVLGGLLVYNAVMLLLLRRSRHLGRSIRFFAVSSLTGLITIPLWAGLKPYQQKRILSFLNPKNDPLGSGWQVLQSKVAIGSGGWIGKGFLAGTQKKMAFLPAQHTDFIFSILGEEFGYLGVLILLLLFFFVLMRIVEIARCVSSNTFSSLMAFGFTAIWFFHMFVNVGMTLGIMPVTGLPLPFVSYGGSFLVACYFTLGILLRISSERFSYWIQ